MPPGRRSEEGFVVGNSGKTVVVSPMYSRCRLREKSSELKCSINQTNGYTISELDSNCKLFDKMDSRKQVKFNNNIQVDYFENTR